MNRGALGILLIEIDEETPKALSSEQAEETQTGESAESDDYIDDRNRAIANKDRKREEEDRL